MKRSYDYSFVSERNNITSSSDAHCIPQQHIATPATHTPFEFYTTTSGQSFLNAYRNVGSLDHILEFHVPLLSSTIGFNPDFQSNTGIQADLRNLGSLKTDITSTGGTSSKLSGLGIQYDDSSGNTSVSSSSSQTLFQPNQEYSVFSDAHSVGLSFHDLCHIDSSSDYGISKLQAAKDYAGPAAYSRSPIRDYIAHAPSASSSVPSLSRGSRSDNSLTDSLNTYVVKDHLRDLLDLYSPRLHSETGTLSEPLVGLFADINMRQLAVKNEVQEVGVSPADVMGADAYFKQEDEKPVQDGMVSPGTRSPPIDARVDPGQEGATMAPFPDEAINAIVSVLSASEKQNQVKAQTSLASTYACSGYINVSSLTPPSPALAYLTAMGSAGTPSAYVSPGLVFQSPGRMPLSGMYVPQSLPDVLPIKTIPMVVRAQSPVLNAHLGIELEDLRRRADEFRRSNPEIDIDKTWLQAYAGRLSQRGELIDDYRCYVIGCSQRNKRRDHILVHVGSHVEHRPFQCGHCGMRFLRKNECKRHEASHGGRKPFQCLICAPLQDRSFVRQDLLKRHMRVTHGIQSESLADRRKRMRMETEADFWP